MLGRPGAWVPSQLREPRSRKLHSGQRKKNTKVQAGEPGFEPGSVTASVVKGGDPDTFLCVCWGGGGEEEDGEGQTLGASGLIHLGNKSPQTPLPSMRIQVSPEPRGRTRQP